MRTKVTAALPEAVLTRILEAFGQELIDASDEEIMLAARDLGMDLQMKGSAAFAGLTFPAKWQVSDFFDVEALRQRMAREVARPVPHAVSTLRSEASTRSKDSGEK